jgi:AcrR family transcriptional regulator
VNEARASLHRPRKPASREAARSNLRAQGLRTRNLIVQAATQLLLQRGGLDFTLRAVARQAKISLGNLRYYFPEREELLRAVLAPVFDTYLADLDRVLNSNALPSEAFEALVQRALRDAKDSKTMVLMWLFAARSAVDPECARIFGEWYETLARAIAKLMERINPDLGPAASVRLSLLVIAMGDGLGYLMQSNGKRPHMRDLEADFRAMTDFLVHHNPMMEREKPATKGPRKAA